MPIYAYVCGGCGQELEALQKISDPPLQDCPACGKPQLAKKVTAAAFRLKGTGWYETDFKNKDKKKADKTADKKAGGEKPGKESGSAGGGSSDTKSKKPSASSSKGG